MGHSRRRRARGLKFARNHTRSQVRCSKLHPEVCPDKQHLARLSSMELSAEGVLGRFLLEVKSISAVSA